MYKIPIVILIKSSLQDDLKVELNSEYLQRTFKLEYIHFIQ